MYSQVSQILSKHLSLSQCVWSRTRKDSLTCSPHLPVLLLEILCSATRIISLPADAIAEMCATSSPSVRHCKTIILYIPHLPELFIPAILTCLIIQAMCPNKVVTVFTYPLFSVFPDTRHVKYTFENVCNAEYFHTCYRSTVNKKV